MQMMSIEDCDAMSLGCVDLKVAHGVWQGEVAAQAVAGGRERAGEVLQAAADAGSSKLCRVVLDACPDAPVGDILIRAARKGCRVEVGRVLLERDGISSDQGVLDHALFIAAERGSVPWCKMLLQRGARADAPVVDSAGATDGSALYVAAAEGHVPVVVLMLMWCSEVDSKVLSKSLFIAAKGGHTTVCELLLRRGASLGLALCYAVIYGTADAVHLLLGLGHVTARWFELAVLFASSEVRGVLMRHAWRALPLVAAKLHVVHECPGLLRRLRERARRCAGFVKRLVVCGV